jgi:hypothetical protein
MLQVEQSFSAAPILWTLAKSAFSGHATRSRAFIWTAPLQIDTFRRKIRLVI